MMTAGCPFFPWPGRGATRGWNQQNFGLSSLRTAFASTSNGSTSGPPAWSNPNDRSDARTANDLDMLFLAITFRLGIRDILDCISNFRHTFSLIVVQIANAFVHRQADRRALPWDMLGRGLTTTTT